jgi:hypothetical protein
LARWQDAFEFLSDCLLPDCCNKTISSLGNGLDQGLSVLALCERAAQDRDVMGKISLLDDGIGPNQFQQLFFFHQLSVPFDQGEEQVKRLGRQGYPFTVTEQELFSGIQVEGSECKQALGFLEHSRA